MKFKPLFYIFLIVLSLGLGADYIYLSLTPHYTPTTTPVDLSPILQKESFTPLDYKLLFRQTGLAEPIINELKELPDFIPKMLTFQKDYLADVPIFNTYMPPATFCQLVGSHAKGKSKAFTLAPYHNSYLLFTNGTHSFGWRHGHVALVVDEIRGLTLEAICPGTVSCLQHIEKWEYYPTFKMMRLKEAPQSQLNAISDYALAQLQGLPYNILGTKNEISPKSTHCALLIWQAFIYFGYDLDSTGGLFVTPKDIACSPLLECLQIYGFNPNKDW